MRVPFVAMAIVTSLSEHGWILSHQLHIQRCHDGLSPSPDMVSVAKPYYAIAEAKPGSHGNQAKKRKVELNERQTGYNAYHEQLVQTLSPSIKALRRAWPASQPGESLVSVEDDAEAATTDDAQYAELCQLASLGGGDSELPILDLEVDAHNETVELMADEIIGRAVCNPHDKTIRMNVLGRQYVVPARSRFIMSDFKGVAALTRVQPEGGFSLVVLDPPWENKSAKRSKSYSWLPHTQLARIPMRAVAGRGALVAVWVTNNPRYLDYVRGDLFRKWGVAPVATWYWLKVAVTGEPVIPLASPHRKPYEPLVIGRVGPAKPDENIPETRVLVSVPTKHSRKPPLDEVLAPFLPDDPQRLELFARSLIPGWTSWGNEPIKFQEMAHFRQVAE